MWLYYLGYGGETFWQMYITIQHSLFICLQLKTTILDGEFIRVFVVAVDVMGNNATDSLVVGVDSSAPRFVEHKFEKNVDSGNPQLPYSSRCVRLMRIGWH